MPDPIPVFNSPAPLDPADFAPVQEGLELFNPPTVDPVPAVLVEIPVALPYPTKETSP